MGRPKSVGLKGTGRAFKIQHAQKMSIQKAKELQERMSQERKNRLEVRREARLEWSSIDDTRGIDDAGEPARRDPATHILLHRP
jgi:hypothetical protein